ncbi:MAG: transporter [Planctomycetota bacterium]|nr:MAG: transporter [Planctomycetota bacterium]
MISGFEQLLLALMVIGIMFGMGSTIDLVDVRRALRTPKAVLIGMSSQFGLMPLVAYGLAQLCGLTPAQTVGLVLVGCLPAGTTSNMFSYFARGDVALSITMTCCSTLLALVMMPLLLGFYTADARAQLGAEGLHIPYLQIMMTLVSVLIPVSLGMWLRRVSPGWARVAEDTAGFLGFLVIVVLIAGWLPRNHSELAGTHGGVLLAVVGLGVAGFTFGHVCAWLVGCPPRHRRTIALETGIQNSPLSFAIILVSFPLAVANELLWLPILYAFFIVISASVWTLIMRHLGREDAEAHIHATICERLVARIE